MSRAKLQPSDVKRIIIKATMEPPSEDALEKFLVKRREDGHLDGGIHYFISARGQCTAVVPDDERGSHIPRYSASSITILLTGGKDQAGSYAKNFGVLPMYRLCKLVEELQAKYPKARPTMYRELFRGINPVIEHEDYITWEG